MKKYDAVISGYFCVDITPNFKEHKSVTSIYEILQPGKLIEIGGLNVTLGGIVANTGIAMKKFSNSVFFNGIIGNDFIGKIAMGMLKEYEIIGDIKIMEGTNTAFSLVIAPAGIDRIFLESPGCSKLFDSSCINFGAIAQSRLFHFGYPPLLRQFYLQEGRRLVELFSEIQKMKVVTSMDFSLPDENSESGKVDWLNILQQVFPFTDIFVPSLEEALQIMIPSTYKDLRSAKDSGEAIGHIPNETIREIAKRIIDAGVKIVLIKAGPRGAYLRTGDVTSLNEKPGFNLEGRSWNFREIWCDAYPVDYNKIKNTSGTGDAAAAAFLTAILDGESPESSLQYAAFAGRDKLYCCDIFREMCEWSEIRQGIRSEINRVTDLNN